MLGIGFSDDDDDDIKIISNEGRSGDIEAVTTLDNLVNDNNFLVCDFLSSLFRIPMPNQNKPVDF